MLEYTLADLFCLDGDIRTDPVFLGGAKCRDEGRVDLGLSFDRHLKVSKSLDDEAKVDRSNGEMRFDNTLRDSDLDKPRFVLTPKLACFKRDTQGFETENRQARNGIEPVGERFYVTGWKGNELEYLLIAVYLTRCDTLP